MNKLKLVGADVWTSIESAFAPVMEELIKKLSIAVDWFSNLSDGSKRSIVIFGGIAAAIGPVVFGLRRIYKYNWQCSNCISPTISWYCKG